MEFEISDGFFGYCFDWFLVGDCFEIFKGVFDFFGVLSCFVDIYVDDDFFDMWDLYWIGVVEFVFYCIVNFVVIFGVKVWCICIRY